jgi:hypothetical protein
MVKRLALSVVVAFTLVGLNIPMPAVGVAASPPAARVLINAPDMPAVDLTPPALPSSTRARRQNPDRPTMSAPFRRMASPSFVSMD